MLDDCLMVMLSDRESELLGLAAQLAKLQPLSSPNNMIGIQNLRNHQDLNFEHPSNSGRGSDDWKSWEQILKRPQPPEGYVCFNCYQPGHFIQHCTKEVPADFKLTPYQGSKTCVGEFKCPNCKRAWLSRRSMANLAQRCRKCRQRVYPRKQYSEDTASKCGIFEKEIYKKEPEPSSKWSESDGLTDSYCSNSSSWQGEGKTEGPSTNVWTWSVFMEDYVRPDQSVHCCHVHA